MAQKVLSLGFDTERPYGNFAYTPEGKDLRKKQIEFVAKINEEYDKLGAPRTFFILGHYLDASLDEFSQEHLQQIYDKSNLLIELQQHSYSHLIFRPIKGRDDAVVGAGEFIEDLSNANETIEKILDVKPDGLRVPIGYDQDMSNQTEILQGLKKLGIRYISSVTRSKDSMNAPFGKDKQPHHYGKEEYPDIAEIPSHGWQDAIFTPENTRKLLQKGPFSPKGIIEHYEGLFADARKINSDFVSVGLSLHPWAMMEYDPKLEIHKHLIGSAREKGFEIVTYGKVADIVLSQNT